MPQMNSEFGYYPNSLNFTVDDIIVSTLAGLDQSVIAVQNSAKVENDWIYPGMMERHSQSGEVRYLPYASRVFGLPKTHMIEHANADNQEHLDFLVWALSFFTGMRLTTTEAGFIDATPIKQSKLVDFWHSGRDCPKALKLAEAFWQANKLDPNRAKLWSAAVHVLFVSHWPHALQFEQFIYLYGALDTCFALMRRITSLSQKIHYSARIKWMCQYFNMPVPTWASPASSGSSKVAHIRNATIHESLFMAAPLGFALHGIGTDQNLILEMQALTCRLLAEILGLANTDYVRSSTGSRQMHGIDFGPV